MFSLFFLLHLDLQILFKNLQNMTLSNLLIQQTMYLNPHLKK
ncbi:hypothetical protein M33023_04010 [Candidatus Phytoplasma asteris]|uniref:Uncharacterized protein n=1 Tax=Candidatus Phytoplasma asteris TaxID=85620 RepID=A0ABZ2YI01_9MOLU